MEKALLKIIETAQKRFHQRLKDLEKKTGLTEEYYIRYLSMQFHLTRGVQKHFFQIAGHPDLSRRRSLRKFLVSFANEEELHFEVALNDLKELNQTPLECPLDVSLWWAFFSGVVETRPFVRLGATCILENIADPAKDTIQALFSKARYLSEKNTRFFAMHQHDEALPHGKEILEALSTARLEDSHWRDVLYGAEIGSEMYLRMVDWALQRPRD